MAKITIFGLAGTGTSSTGKALAKELGYEFVSTGSMFRAKAAELGLDLHEFQKRCNENPQFDRDLDREIEHYGKVHDNFVMESRLAWHFVPDSFKIKFVCDFNERMERVARRDGSSLEEAIEKTTFREEWGPKNYVTTYGITEFAPDRIFDLIIDTTSTPPREVLSHILEAIHRFLIKP